MALIIRDGWVFLFSFLNFNENVLLAFWTAVGLTCWEGWCTCAGTSTWPPLCWLCGAQCSLSWDFCLRCWNLAYPAPVPGITNSHLASSKSRADRQDSHIEEIPLRVTRWPNELWSKRPIPQCLMELWPAAWRTHHLSIGLLWRPDLQHLPATPT